LHERGRHSSPGSDWSSRTSTVRAVMNAPVRPPPGLYGDELAASFGADAPAPFVVTQSMPHAELAVTELRVDEPSRAHLRPSPV
jgi:hypothetical protein